MTRKQCLLRPLMRRRLLWLVITTAVAAWLGSPVLAERPNAPQLLPETTAALVWIPDAPEMSERFMSTSFGKMLQDPQLKPLISHLYGSAAEAVAAMKDRIGLSLPELLAIPQGEVTVALIAPEEGRPELVLLLDVGDHLSNARTLIEKGTEQIERSGAEKSEQAVGDTKLVIYDGVGPRKRRLAYFEKDSTVVAGSSVDVLKQILAIWNGSKKDTRTLSDDGEFKAVMRLSGPEGKKPHLVWYADPIALMRSIGQENAGVQLTVAMLPALGLDGVKALGGSLTYDAGQFDSVGCWHILLDTPRSGILKMIALEPVDIEPEPWVPADAASYMTLHWDFQTTFDELVRLFDSFRGEGALAELLGSQLKETIGIDIEKELLPALAGRVSLCSRIQQPINLQSAATAVGLRLTDAKAFDEVLQKVFAKYEAFWDRKSYAGREYFQLAPPGARDQPDRPPQPIPCVGIVGDYLILTDRPALFEKVILTSQGAVEPLADSLEFKLVASNIRRQSGDAQPAMISFERPQEGLRLYYELANSDNVRQQLRQQAESNPFLKPLNTALDENPLPPFAVIEQYFAPTGGILVNDETGLHTMGFSLRRKTE